MANMKADMKKMKEGSKKDNASEKQMPMKKGKKAAMPPGC